MGWGRQADIGDERSQRARTHRVVYCVVPGDLAAKLHDYLRTHWRDDRNVCVVVEQRTAERRGVERRVATSTDPAMSERRRIMNAEGRRIVERRATALAVEPPPLPRRARPYAARLMFLERLEPNAQTMADAEANRLVVQLQGGDAAAMTELYLSYFDRVYAYARIALRDAHEAEDATQQAFANVLQALPRYRIRRDTPFRAWLFRIARNVVIDVLRARARLEPRDPVQIGLRRERSRRQDVEQTLTWVSDADLAIFIERLPAPQREVMVLRYMLDLKHDEIAGVINRTPKAVRNLQARALKTLEERLVAIGRGPVPTRRANMVMRRRPAPVISARRFALAYSVNPGLAQRRA